MRRCYLRFGTRRSYGSVLALVAALLGGCARFEPRPLNLAATSDDFDRRRLDAPELRAFLETNSGPVAAWPLPHWTFEHLALASLFYQPRLAVARAQVVAARAAEITAGARPNPTLGLTPEYNFNPASGVTPWIATVQFDFPIETAGKRGHRLARARQLSEAARRRLHSAAWEVRSTVRAAWLELQDAGRRTNWLARQFEAQERVVSALETKRALDAVTTGEVAPARLALARTRKDLTEAAGQADESRARLAIALGVPLSFLPPAAALLLPFSMSDADTDAGADASLTSPAARRHALTSRADLLAALADYAAAESALKLEVARQYPDVHLGTGYQFEQGENKWALGVSMELPVLHRNQGPIAEAEARRAEAAARALALQAAILGEVDRALAAWQGARSRLTALNDLRAAHEARLASLQAQLAAGAAESLDVLLAEVELAADEGIYWQTRLQVLRALGALEDALQVPLLPDVSSHPRPAPRRSGGVPFGADLRSPCPSGGASRFLPL